jgi:hypothetical protein
MEQAIVDLFVRLYASTVLPVHLGAVGPHPIPAPPGCPTSGIGTRRARFRCRHAAVAQASCLGGSPPALARGASRATLLHLGCRRTSVVLPRCSPFPSGARVGMQVRVVAPLQHLRVAPHLPLPQRCFPSPSGCRPRQTSPLPPRRSRPACSLRPYTTPAPVPLAPPIRRRARHRATL